MTIGVSNSKVWNGSEWVGDSSEAEAELTGHYGSRSAMGAAPSTSIGFLPATGLLGGVYTQNTKGAWTPIIESTSFDAEVLVLYVATTVNSSSNTCYLGDVGIGLEGSEQVLVGNVGVGHSTGTGNPHWIRSVTIPVKVPSGSRLSFRWQAARTTAPTLNPQVAIILGTAPFDSPTTIDTLGADTSTSTGTAMAGTGQQTQIVASASRAYRGFVVCPMNDRTELNTSGFSITIGIGPEGSQTLYMCSKLFRIDTAERIINTSPGSTYVNAPCAQGQRVSAAITDSTTTNWSGGTGTKYYNLVLLGVPA
jgi:hypothetical protein